MSFVFSLYKKLFSLYGPQGWWPIIKKGSILYHPGDYKTPKNEKERFQIVIGSILTQNTNWKNAESALISLYKKNMLNFSSLYNAPLSKIAKLIRSSGYYNQKAQRIKHILPVYKKIKKLNNVKKMRELLLATKGIGPETADSILLYAFKKPVFVVDAYTRKFCEINGISRFKSYDEYQEFFERNLPKDYAVYNEFHALIVKWGKLNNNLNRKRLI